MGRYMDCLDCGWKEGGHDPACPGLAPEDLERRAQYKNGRSDGRQAKSQASSDPTYLLGYHKGIVALEEAQNGCQTWGY